MTRFFARKLIAAAMGAGLGTAIVLPIASCSLEVFGRASADDAASTDGATPDVIADGPVEDVTSSDAAPDVGSAADACPPLPSGWSRADVLVGGGSCPGGFAGPVAFVEAPSVGTAPCTCTCGAPSANPCFHPGTVNVRVHIAGNGGGCGTSGVGESTNACQTPVPWDTGIDALTGRPEPPVNVACAAITTKPPVASATQLTACLANDFGDAGATTSACLPAAGGACIAKPGVEPTCPVGFSNRRVVTRTTDVIDQRTCAACACNTNATSCTNATISFFTADAVCGGASRVAVLNGSCNPFDGNFNPSSARYAATPSPNTCAAFSATTAIGGTVTSAAQTTFCCAP